MGKKTVTTGSQQAQFDPTSMAAFQQLTPAGSNVLQQYMKSPDQNAFFQLRLGQALGQNRAFGQTMNQNYLQNLQQFGLGGAGTPLAAAGLARNARTLSAMNAGSNVNLLLGMEQLRRQATESAMGYRPLQTGSSFQQQQQVSGLGTWLPQLIQGGLAAAMAPMTGGASLFGLLGRGQNTSGPYGSLSYGSPFDWNKMTGSPMGLGQMQVESPYNPIGYSPAWLSPAGPPAAPGSSFFGLGAGF